MTYADSIRHLISLQVEDSAKLQPLASLALHQFYASKWDDASATLDEILNLTEVSLDGQEAPWPNWKAFALNLSGTISYQQGDYLKAIQYHEKAIPFALLSRNKKIEGEAYMSLGINHWSTGDYPIALAYDYKALKIFESIRDSIRLADVFNAIGGVQEYLNHLEDARLNYEQALLISLAIGNQWGMASAYNNLGNVSDYLDQFDESLCYHGMALMIYEALQDDQGMANAHDNLASTYFNQHNLTESNRHDQLALALKQEIGDQLGIATSYSNMGIILLEQGAPDKAIDYFSQSLQIAKSLHARDRIMDAYEGLANGYKAKGQYKEAYLNSNAYSVMRDSLRNQENDEAIAEMHAKYESDKKDAQIRFLHTEQELLSSIQKRKSLVRNLVISAALLGVAFLFIFYRTKQSLRMEKLRVKISSDLHDEVGSTLSSISIYSAAIERMGADRIQERLPTIALIGKSAREAMDNMSDIVWAINPNHDTFKNITDRLLQFAPQLLESKNILMKMDIPKTLDAANLTMEQRKDIYLILREAIQNVAKYSHATNCILSGIVDRHMISLMVVDDGVGFDTITPGMNGNGLKNMKQRARDLKAKLEIHSELKKGTRIALHVSL